MFKIIFSKFKVNDCVVRLHLYNKQLNKITNEKIKTIISGISKCNNNSYSGCWDVLGWKDDKIIFAESKRTKKDKIRSTQINWLSAGLKFGLKAEKFLIVEWDIK